MTDQKAYQEYIQRRYNASCKAVIRCAWQRPSVPELCRAPHNSVVFPSLLWYYFDTNKLYSRK